MPYASESQRWGCATTLQIRISITLLLSVSVVSPLFATDYYISASGNDRKGNGSISKPWKSISQLNRQTFTQGDRILFEAGSTYDGRLYLDSKDRGTASAPITITSYGSGRATLSNSSSEAMYFYNTAGIVISNLNVTGPGPSNKSNGIVFYADLSGNVKLDSVVIDNVEVSRFGKYGIWIGSWNGTTGYSNVRVTNVSSHDNVEGGITTIGYNPVSYGYAHQNVYIANCQAYNNLGVSGTSSSSGSGIVIGQVDGATIERSVSYNNGANNTAYGGPVGIWAWDSNRVLIQYNEAHHNRTSSIDGGGFDLDGGVTNSVMQYNYSHDNDGPGFLLAQYSGARTHASNVIRYNISQNDARRNGVGAIHIWNGGSGIQSVEIYNNTVYLSSAASTPKAVMIDSAVTDVHLRNNIFMTTGGVPTLYVVGGQSGFQAQANNYWSGGGSLNIYFGGSTFSDLNGFRSTGQETASGSPVGMAVDPMLTAPGAAPTLNNANALSSLTAYRLQAGSPLIDRALNLGSFGISPGANDFYGGSTPKGAAYDVGANEY
jgi:hypothetical protein